MHVKLFKKSNPIAKSEFDYEEIIVKKKTFYTDIKFISSSKTVTKKGTSRRSILFTTPYSLITVPEYYFNNFEDPNSFIYLNAGHFASYNLNLSGLENIYSAITAKESKTAVLAYGHDIFFTYLWPSGKFDSLKPDFNKPILVAAMIGLFMICLALHFLNEKAKMETEWQ